VTPEIDGGEIILQKSISVHPNETAWQLGQRVFNEENQLLLDSIKLLKSNFKIG
jgi:phosphoribosylglycinamide formyltransferase-1